MWRELQFALIRFFLCASALIPAFGWFVSVHKVGYKFLASKHYIRNLVLSLLGIPPHKYWYNYSPGVSLHAIMYQAFTPIMYQEFTPIMYH